MNINLRSAIQPLGIKFVFSLMAMAVLVLPPLSDAQPLVFEDEKLLATAGDGTDSFGSAVSVFDGVALVGAPVADAAIEGQNHGAAYVFEYQTETNEWVQASEVVLPVLPQRLYSPHFGWATALSQGFGVVGAWGDMDDHAGGSDVGSGAAHIVQHDSADPTSWTLGPRLRPPIPQFEARFGWSVAASGDVIVIGEPNRDRTESEVDAGAAYVSVRGADSNWSDPEELVRTDGDDPTNGQFGSAVAVDDTIAVVGAPRFNSGTGCDGGAVYVFSRVDATWTQSARLCGSSWLYFGSSVAIDEGRMAVQTGLRSFGIFESTGDQWQQTGSVELSTSEIVKSVSLSGDFAAVTVWYPESVYVYQRQPDNSWAHISTLVASDSPDYIGFGQDAAISGTMVIAGAPGFDVGSETDQGAAYIFTIGSAPESCVLTASPESLDFGVVDVGSTHTLNVTLENSGAGDCTVATTVEPAAGPFAITSPPTVVGSAESIDVAVSYAPSDYVTDTGFVTFSAEETGSEMTVQLSGTGNAPCRPVVSPTALDFGNVLAGESATLAATVSNSGYGVCTVNAAVSSAGGEFVLGSASTVTVTEATPADVAVYYVPADAGADEGTLQLTFTELAGQDPIVVPLSGTGEDDSPPGPATAEEAIAEIIALAETADTAYPAINGILDRTLSVALWFAGRDGPYSDRIASLLLQGVIDYVTRISGRLIDAEDAAAIVAAAETAIALL